MELIFQKIDVISIPAVRPARSAVPRTSSACGRGNARIARPAAERKGWRTDRRRTGREACETAASAEGGACQSRSLAIHWNRPISRGASPPFTGASAVCGGIVHEPKATMRSLQLPHPAEHPHSPLPSRARATSQGSRRLQLCASPTAARAEICHGRSCSAARRRPRVRPRECAPPLFPTQPFFVLRP